MVNDLSVMKLTAFFQFHGALNDFLSSAKKNTTILWQLNEPSSIKDAIEALGIPHPEVFKITVNNIDVDFKYLLKTSDRVEVFPYEGPIDYIGIETRFILDVHLGKLAKNLRMLGIDTLYRNDYAEKQIVQIASNGNLIVLTRDKILLKHAAIRYGYCLRSNKLVEQLNEVITRFGLKEKIKPFTRCLECNGLIVAVAKDLVAEKVPEKSRQYYEEFFQCNDCRRIYWKGTHYERMKMRIERIE
jgi:uncharacterized protein